MASKVFEKLMKDEYYQKLIKELPDDERKVIVESLKKLCEDFEEGIINPLNNLL